MENQIEEDTEMTLKLGLFGVYKVTTMFVFRGPPHLLQ